MSLIDKAAEHFGMYEVRIIEVPEWEAVIYAKPINIAEKQKLTKLAQGDDYEFLMRLMVMKAEDEQGNKLFREADLMKIRREVDPAIVARVATQIGRAPTVEEQQGN